MAAYAAARAQYYYRQAVVLVVELFGRIELVTPETVQPSADCTCVLQYTFQSGFAVI